MKERRVAAGKTALMRIALGAYLLSALFTGTVFAVWKPEAVSCAETQGSEAAISAKTQGSEAAISAETQISDAVFQAEIRLPDASRDYRILWISDMHLFSYPEDVHVTEHAEERPEILEKAEDRLKLLTNEDGKGPNEVWSEIAEQIDDYKADLLILGADMIDYVSAENLRVLESELEKVRTPWIYFRADHDYDRSYTGMDLEEMRALHRTIAPQEKLTRIDFDDFILVTLDNTTSAVSDKTLKQFEKILSEKKPVILASHVPFDSERTDSLKELSKTYWGDRVLCWGSGDYYDTQKSENMDKLTELVFAEDSPVAAVLSGHLHKTWSGDLTDRCREYVFGAGCSGQIGLVTVTAS